MEPVFTVSEFNELISNHLALLGEVTVEGELSELKVSQGKWIYATLQDEEASVGLFGTVFQIRNLNSLDVGMKVKVTGIATLYRKTARFSLNVTSITPSGEGALLAAYEKLKAKLEQEGLFDPSRQRILPQFPERIGLLTARDSQAYQDFVKVSISRIGGFKIYFYPVNVQGREAVNSVIGGIRYFQDKDIDVLVLTRGGGSLEDLAAFNDEQIVREIFASRIPTVCAIGHEGDISLVELVADVRGSTPSNAAELIFRDRHAVVSQVDNACHMLNEKVLSQINEVEHLTTIALNTISHHLDHSMGMVELSINNFGRYFDSFILRLDHLDQLVNQAEATVTKAFLAWTRLIEERVTHLEDKLRSLDPVAVLRRGFSIVKDSAGAIISSVSYLHPGDSATITLSDGVVTSQVISIDKESHD